MLEQRMGGLNLPFWILKYQSFKLSSGRRGGEGRNSAVSPAKPTFLLIWLRLHIPFGLNFAITHTHTEHGKTIIETEEFGPSLVTRRKSLSTAENIAALMMQGSYWDFLGSHLPNFMMALEGMVHGWGISGAYYFEWHSNLRRGMIFEKLQCFWPSARQIKQLLKNKNLGTLSIIPYYFFWLTRLQIWSKCVF